MDRRNFIGLALSSLGLEVVRRMEDNPPDPLPVKLDYTKPITGRIEFGDLGMVVGEKAEETLRINTPWVKCHNGYRLEHLTDVYVGLVACPKVVFESILKTYGDVTKAKTNPPVKIYVQDKCIATLDSVVITQVGTSVRSEDFVMVENLHFVGVWTKLRDAVRRFNEEMQKDAKEYQDRVAQKFNDAIAADEVIPFVVTDPKS